MSNIQTYTFIYITYGYARHRRNARYTKDITETNHKNITAKRHEKHN